jgi:host factor-I protein
VAKGKPGIQDQYLKQMQENGLTVRIVMVNGKELVGTIAGFDAFTVLVSVGDVEVMVYKSAIAVIGPTGSDKP